MGTFTAQVKIYSTKYFCNFYPDKNFSCMVLSIITAIVSFPGSLIVFQYMSERVTYIPNHYRDKEEFSYELGKLILTDS